MDTKNRKDIFDENFEVTYEEEFPEIPVDDQNDYPTYKTSIDSNFSEDIYSQPYRAPSERSPKSGYTKKDYRRSSEPKSRQNYQKSSPSRDKRKKKARRIPNFASPVKKTAHASVKATSSVIQKICKTASLILMFLITCLMAYKFWTNHSTYGAIATVVSDRNYILGAYVAVALVLLLFEIISFLWATSGPRVSNRQGRSFKSDTGRGMFSFILICTGSFAAKILFFMVPETPAPLIGVRGALMVYGSMFDLLVKLGIAGIISCILRKIFSR